MLIAFGILVLSGCVKPAPPTTDIWIATTIGDLAAIRQHTAAGTDLNGKDPVGGSTPLHLAALYGQTAAAELLIEKGANISQHNNDGATPLHLAAFFCHPEIVKLLINKGVDLKAVNSRGETALNTVSSPWDAGLSKGYTDAGGLLRIPIDLDHIRKTRPEIAKQLKSAGG